jgi:hypothetical protein
VIEVSLIKFFDLIILLLFVDSTNNNSVLSSIMNTSSHLSFNDAQNEFLLNQLATDPMTKELRLFLKQDENDQETNRK